MRNRARPEGSIAESYIADECLTFCSKMMWYVLNNCGQAQKYIEMFRDGLNRKGVPNVDKELRKEFQTCFKNYMMRLRMSIVKR